MGKDGGRGREREGGREGGGGRSNIRAVQEHMQLTWLGRKDGGGGEE